MSDIIHTEEYHIQEDVFSKEYLDDNQVRFLKNGQVLDLEAWNRELNLFQSMVLKEQHPNPLIRWQEGHRRRGFLRFANVQPGERVADVGCESGYLSAKLVEQGCQVVCIDLDPALIEMARQRIGPDRAEFLGSDIQNIRLPDASVDVAIASEILEHLPNPEAGLRELLRITRPGGRIVISVPNEVLVLRAKRTLRVLRLTRLLGSLSENLAIGHVQIFGKRALRALCQRAGVSPVRVFLHLPLCLNVFALIQRD